MEIVAIISLVVAIGAVVWAVRQPAKTQNQIDTNQIDTNQIDTKGIFDGIEKYLNAQKESLDSHISSLLNPTKEEFANVSKRIKDLNTSYDQNSGSTQQLNETVQALNATATNLDRSMKSSGDRGHWGETSLENLLRYVGLIEHAEFKLQETIEGGSRPDCVVELPDGRKIAIDAKAPGSAYMQLPEAEPAARKGLLDEHVKAIQAHVKQLSDKDYPGKLGKSIGFVVMFIPLESMLSDAFQHRPELLKESLEKKVLLATPITLLALLTAVKKGWEAVVFEENLDQIKERLSIIYGRFIPLINHFNDLGKELGQATGKYNDVLKSVEGSVMVGLDEIKKLGLKSKNEESHSSLMTVDEEPIELSEEKVREYADQLDVGDDLEESND
tara:strand:+ start:31 stop:1188 length:1158 start_codon:yes stop_codon:yes gene_type:complete